MSPTLRPSEADAAALEQLGFDALLEGYPEPGGTGRRCKCRACVRTRRWVHVNKPEADRFMTFVEVDAAGCWLWTGARMKNGYGRFGLGDGTTRFAHRVAYELFVGPIPDGLVIDHTCAVKQCVNPAHLEAVTNAENHRRWTATIEYCPRGHAYDEANTLRNGPSRSCRTCRQEQYRRRSEARKAERAWQRLRDQGLDETHLRTAAGDR